MIVTSELANESLWAEALNFGAHDVLAKPLNAGEAVRVLGWAWLHLGRFAQATRSVPVPRVL